MTEQLPLVGSSLWHPQLRSACLVLAFEALRVQPNPSSMAAQQVFEDNWKGREQTLKPELVLVEVLAEVLALLLSL